MWPWVKTNATILGVILVVGLGCSLGANQDFDPWPCQKYWQTRVTVGVGQYIITREPQIVVHVSIYQGSILGTYF